MRGLLKQNNTHSWQSKGVVLCVWLAKFRPKSAVWIRSMDLTDVDATIKVIRTVKASLAG
jgi:hypothetical protein